MKTSRFSEELIISLDFVSSSACLIGASNSIKNSRGGRLGSRVHVFIPACVDHRASDDKHMRTTGMQRMRVAQ